MKKITIFPSVIFLVSLLISVCVFSPWSMAQASPSTVTLAGNLQSELGCPDDWQPPCAATFLTKIDTRWIATFNLPAGNWEYKVAINGSWAENYGAGAINNGPNITLNLTEAKQVTFLYDEVTHLIFNDANGPLPTDPPVIPQPNSVTLAGSLQSELGCSGDWQADCANTHLTLKVSDQVWKKSFVVPAGDWDYKVAINDAWTENYGANAVSNGSNIRLSLANQREVNFYYSHATHWVTSNVNSVIAIATGDFQSFLGCSGNWQPDCLRTWLQDADGDGLYTMTTFSLPPGNYQAKVTINESWDESYGDNGNNVNFTVAQQNQKIVFTYDATNKKVYIGEPVSAGNVKKAKAYWLSRDTIAIDTESLNISSNALSNLGVKLHYSASANLTSSPAGVVGGESIDLSYAAAGLSDALKAKYRHLKNLTAFKIDSGDLDKVRNILKQQIAVSVTGASGNLLEATGLQFAGALDDLFFYNGDLGPLYTGTALKVKLWAPTAKSVKLLVFNTADSQAVPQEYAMNLDAASGVWSSAGNAAWNRKYYLYEIEVFVRASGKFETLRVTDPYSLNTATNGKLSQFINLNDADLKPEGWDKLIKPVFTVPEDMAIYELHVRDFSISDQTVPENLRGTYAAFNEKKSLGMRHLKRLARAGLSHVHLLPVYDCATINENKSQQKTVNTDLSLFATDSEEQQAAVNAIRGEDGFNWCYDPLHYTVPDGSYATDPNGATRIREFRSMVYELNRIGLRVIMDVVYNHTSGSGLVDTSVLDKVVPNYYHRLNREGGIERSTCCENTASENLMMEKLMKDSIKTWTKAYKVDGFRYDIMGHHTKDNIVNIKNEIHSLTKMRDGVNGREVYFYGEGWNFGEVVNDTLFTQARIGNMSGTGIGTFNNFIRDAVRGGGPFDSGIAHVQSQSFANGLYTDPNEENTASAGARDYLLKQTDILKVALAGSLKDYRLVDATGMEKSAAEIDGAGYTLDPQETINYIEAHDNETLFDMIQYKAPLSTSMEDRVRIQNLSNALLIFSQGIPFIHAGQDMLRSKSMDRNTYDAGDWFNILDFSYQKNGWGRGLPLKSENEKNWTVVKPRLADPRLMPTERDIRHARDNTRRLLEIRQSSKLFRLETAEQIKQQVSFFNAGPQQIPGVIAMHIKDSRANLDPQNEQILVIFNANPTSTTLTIPELTFTDFSLHPIQAGSNDKPVKKSVVDSRAGKFTVAGRTAAVFVSCRK